MKCVRLVREMLDESDVVQVNDLLALLVPASVCFHVQSIADKYAFHQVGGNFGVRTTNEYVGATPDLMKVR